MSLFKNSIILRAASVISIVLLFIISITLLFPTFSIRAYASTCTTPTDPNVASICTYPVEIDNGYPYNPFATDMYENTTLMGSPLIIRPSNIVYGADGNVWFLSSDQSIQTILRMTPTGTITPYNLSNGNVAVDIINGPDGNIWFAEQGTVGGVGFITPGGKITEYSVSGSTVPNNITAGSDGNFWFNDLGAIWRITPSGVATKFPLPSGYGNGVGSMITGSDGNLWFAGDNYIGRLTPTGSYTAFTTPTATSGIFKLVTGSDGNLWFGDYSTNKIGRITPTGTITEFSLPNAAGISLKGGITLGPDGNIWFTGIFNNFNAFVSAGDLESITPGGVITDYRLQNEDIVPIDLTSDPNGNLWATGDQVNWSPYAIMRIQIPGAASSPTPTPTPTLIPTQTPTPTPVSNNNVYVALGDSFSSGEGIQPFFEPTNLCHRSEDAYPTLVDLPFTNITYFSLRNIANNWWGFLACSGATTSDVENKQLDIADLTKGKPIQNKTTSIHFVPLSNKTQLVTITVGGDDLNFADVLSFCAYKNDCANDIYIQPQYINHHLTEGITLKQWADNKVKSVKANLITLYKNIHTEAPNAKILVLGYPQLFPASKKEQDCAELLNIKGQHHVIGFSNKDQDFIRLEDTQLNNTIQDAVNTTGISDIKFISVAETFAGHEVCGNGQGGAWINGPSFVQTINGKPQLVKDYSFHPTIKGQAAYADIINNVYPLLKF